MFGLIGGSIGLSLSLILRLELALPGFLICSSIQYNSCITFHGIFMIFFMIMPILIGGFGNILIPLMLSSSDMIFPRVNALGLWLVINGLLLILGNSLYKGFFNYYILNNIISIYLMIGLLFNNII